MTTRVAHIVTRCIAGAGGVAVRGATQLDPHEFESTLIAGSGSGQLELARAHGIRVVLVPELVSPISPREDAVALGRLTRLLEGVDIVHTHSAKAGVLGRIAGRRADARLVHTLHGFPFHDFQSRLVRRGYIQVERRLSSLTDLYLATGTGVSVEAIRLGIARPEQIRTIGPSVDDHCVRVTPERRARARGLLGLPQTGSVVGTVGRMDFQKAPEVLIDALAQMSCPATLVWAGDGPLLDDARKRAARLGLTDRVRLLGNRTDVPEILPAFDVFAMSSRYEGLPCVIVEAQRAGIPVVATTVNAVPDLVSPGETGLLAPPENPRLLAAALDHALAHPELRATWAREAGTRLGSRYDAQTLGTILTEVYRSLVPSREPDAAVWTDPLARVST